MRSTLRALLFLSPTILLTPLVRADQPSAGHADQLVRAALEAELQDAGDRRQQLLSEALSIDPNHSPARWHSGYVRLNGKWTKLADVPKATSTDRRLAAYQKRRDGLLDTEDSHRELARWCAKNKLRDESRVHWTHVLEFRSQDAEALAGLGLKLLNGRYVSQEQVDAQKDAVAERAKTLKAWQPRLDAWRSAFESGHCDKIDDVLEELAQIDDPAAAPLLIAAAALDQKGVHSADLQLTVIRALGNLRSPDATQHLLWVGLNGSGQIRDEALEQLKKRPMHVYVPQLLAALPPEVNSKFEINVLPGGGVVHEHQVEVAGRDADYKYTYENFVQPTDLAAAARATPQALARELRKSTVLQDQVNAAQQQAQDLRSRIQEVLIRTTEFSRGDGTGNWQKQYEEYYGLYMPETEKPYYPSHQKADETYFTMPATTVTGQRYHSCFAAGTQIATASGPRAVDSLKAGDRVLVQDVVSGELTFQPIFATTVAPSMKLVSIRCGTAEPIVATPGHPFWIVGKGWQIARLLQPGDRLHSVQGAVAVDDVQPGPTAEAYNLVVNGFHNYFVGPQQLLVHDNSPLVEQPQRIPGF